MAAQLNLNTEKIEKIKTQVQGINDTASAQAITISEIAALLEGKSVPGGGEDVTAEVTAQTTLIDDLEAAVDALPEAGGGGSGGGSDTVETCDVTINIVGGHMKQIIYVNENGEVKNEYKGSMIGNFTGTVKKGSAFCVASSYSGIYDKYTCSFSNTANYAYCNYGTLFIIVNESDTFTMVSA